MPSTPTVTVTYLFDPLCGWCYAAAPVLARLQATPGVQVVLAPTGLFAGAGARPMDAQFAAYAWSNDQRIAQLTGQPFSPAGWPSPLWRRPSPRVSWRHCTPFSAHGMWTGATPRRPPCWPMC